MQHLFWYVFKLWIINSFILVIYTVCFSWFVKILGNLLSWYILASGCFGIKSSISSIYLSWYGSDIHFTTRVQVDQQGPLLVPADDRAWVRHGLTPTRFWPLSGENTEKTIHSGVIAKASTFLFKKTDFHFFPIGYELSPCKNDRFDMETQWLVGI